MNNNQAKGLDPATVGLLLALGNTIKQFTLHTPMTAEATIEALCFVAGSAMAQSEAHSKHSTRQLRELGIARIDKGIESARGEARYPSLILPN